MPRKPAYDRDAIIDLARDLFWSRGWAGTSLKDLEAALKMKPGSFYAAFGSKERLYELALERYVEDGTKRISALAEEVGPLQALQRYPTVIVENSDIPTKACMLAKTVLELSPQDHTLAEKANVHLLRMERCFEDLFAAAQTEGQIGPSHDPAKLARRYQSDLMGLRVSAERAGFDASTLAQDISDGLGRL